MNGDAHLETFFDQLKNILEKMDRESNYGLRGYNAHVNETFTKNQSRKNGNDERPITYGLTDRLFQYDIPAFGEVRYPNYIQPENPSHEQTCDIVGIIQQDEFLWLEVKVAYTICFGNGFSSHSRATNRREKMKSLSKDCIEKLSKLRRPEATYVAGLLLGFETVCHPFDAAEVNELITNQLSEWRSVHQSQDGIFWPSIVHGCDDYEFRTRCWLWHKKITVSA